MNVPDWLRALGLSALAWKSESLPETFELPLPYTLPSPPSTVTFAATYSSSNTFVESST
jgi:hypothetical protein